MPASKSIDVDLEVSAAIERARRSFEESANDILRRLLLPSVPAAAESPRAEASVATGRRAPFEVASEPGRRSRGRWAVELAGERVAAPNLKEAYRLLLLRLHDRDPDFLQAFSEQSGRGRRFVARRPENLYSTSPALARKHARGLVDGWHFDTNLSTDQVARRVRIAARLTGLRYGGDVRILNNLEEI